jgi:hypothetical protein
MLHGKNMQMTKLLRSEPHSKPISRILDGCAVVDQFHSEYQQRAARKPLAHFDGKRGTNSHAEVRKKLFVCSHIVLLGGVQPLHYCMSGKIPAEGEGTSFGISFYLLKGEGRRVE